ncbi:E3 ubiquitin-protein ligase rad18 [Tieghemiomyces parasiticus]|uniref:Postreplication repair E3 ubiquitin-protein ligase RAD18 n=1 Tax=Tieghemiomyces parasiticus TaxID=78921 RepID=A0A9W7ZQH0_9FUNG|nr:E3 ubiquitin-protein ligase rad18 [Tieghemiomyces parasiticus]
MNLPMLGVVELEDPSDWPLTDLRQLDAHLRCGICKEFYTAAVAVTPCLHRFCSLCVRRSITAAASGPADTKAACPACRVPIDSSCIKGDALLNEIVSAFRRGSQQQPVLIDDSSDDGDDDFVSRPHWTPRAERTAAKPTPAANLAECPNCQCFVATNRINSHLDECLGLKPSDPRPASQPPFSTLRRPTSNTTNPITKLFPSQFHRGPLPASNATLATTFNTQETADGKYSRPTKLVYSIMTDKQLRKALKDLGLSSHGDRLTMQRRHTEYLNLYLANEDALQPKPLADVVAALRRWERKLPSTGQGSSGTQVEELPVVALSTRSQSKSSTTEALPAEAAGVRDEGSGENFKRLVETLKAQRLREREARGRVKAAEPIVQVTPPETADPVAPAHDDTIKEPRPVVVTPKVPNQPEPGLRLPPTSPTPYIPALPSAAKTSSRLTAEPTTTTNRGINNYDAAFSDVEDEASMFDCMPSCLSAGDASPWQRSVINHSRSPLSSSVPPTTVVPAAESPETPIEALSANVRGVIEDNAVAGVTPGFPQRTPRLYDGRSGGYTEGSADDVKGAGMVIPDASTTVSSCYPASGELIMMVGTDTSPADEVVAKNRGAQSHGLLTVVPLKPCEKTEIESPVSSDVHHVQAWEDPTGLIEADRAEKRFGSPPPAPVRRSRRLQK